MTGTPSIDDLLLCARHQPGLACFDTGLNTTLVTWGAGPSCTQTEDWPRFVREHCRMSDSDSSLFSGGVVGWLGYEAGQSTEQMPAPAGPRPTHDVCLWRTDGGLLFDHVHKRWSITGSQEFKASAQQLLGQAESVESELPNQTTTRPWTPENGGPQARQYQEGVATILSAIREGDVYQVNLAWEQANIPIADGLRTWLRIRQMNPALRGCYLCQSSTEVISNSPELFLQIDGRSKHVVSIPIKGTAPICEGPASKSRLYDSPKEQAELTMIVDLVRNDLGRVAVPGSVVAGQRSIRACGDLWHAEQSVSANLQPQHDAVDAVRAAFPPGSVTGAPKVRAMEVIHGLEPGARGIYTGCIGWFADGGSAHFNVAIRTATVQNGLARFHVGAGIVADSNPENEWHETLAKARALAHCLGA